jgi:type I restriction enzyme M protein
MTHIKKPKDSEVNAYVYIKEELDNLGWIVKNPARTDYGEVYQQNECLNNKYLKKYLKRLMPEAVIKLDEDNFWIIESKRDKKEIDKALKEARIYADKINKGNEIKSLIISGIAGNDTDGFIVINQYLNKNKWETILFNNKTKNILLSKEQARYILDNETINYQDFPDIPEKKFIEVGIEINEILHTNGINKNKRARFLSGLVLALLTNSEIDMREEDTTTLVKGINNLIEKKLRDVKKQNFFNFIKLEIPPVEENHINYRTAIKETKKQLDTLDIANAMASGNDILGKFYETFLKYGNGAKEIGIVLTPRHITKFAVEVLDINYRDFILDPACGTGGFLVSAFDYVRNTSNKNQVDKFKNYNIFGIEQEDEVVALALVNMIFRGDGRNNMSSGNCFYKQILKTNIDNTVTGKFILNKKKILENEKPLITKVLMNPPFAIKEKETEFIDYGLSQMEDGGILFAVIPVSVMIKKPFQKWRQNLLKHNTLISVLTFPDDLFYPVGVHTIGIFIKKGSSHDFNKNVYFAKVKEDGFTKRKGVMIFNKNKRNKLEEIKEELKSFINNQNLNFKSVPEFKITSKIDKDDKELELIPEAYLDTDFSSLTKDDFEREIKEHVLFKELNFGE